MWFEFSTLVWCFSRVLIEKRTFLVFAFRLWRWWFTFFSPSKDFKSLILMNSLWNILLYIGFFCPLFSFAFSGHCINSMKFLTLLLHNLVNYLYNTKALSQFYENVNLLLLRNFLSTSSFYYWSGLKPRDPHLSELKFCQLKEN